MKYKKDEHPWEYQRDPSGSPYKLVTLEDAGFSWVGIRYWNPDNRLWFRFDSSPETARVLAWMDIPKPAEGRWVHGELI